MSSYHSSFKYLGKKSDEDFGWIIAHFDPDNGETDSYLSQEQIYSESYNGTKRTLYGTKYNSVANVKITVIKQSGSEFTLKECRDAYKWLTGNPEAEWMDLYIGDEVKYRLLCTIQDVKPQKLDARTVGLNIYCESLSPWAYSSQITLSQSISGSKTIEINNESDDLYTPVYLKTTYKNTNGSSLVIKNTTIGESTEVSGLAANEVITLDNNMMITSDKPSKTFGNSFNFTWPRLKAGSNSLSVTGTGNLTFEYYYPIKMGDCAIDINSVSDPICNDNGEIIVDTLDWNRIVNTPRTLSGYGITDAYTKSSVYNKDEVDGKMGDISREAKSAASLASNLSSNLTNNYYDKNEIDNKLVNLDIPEQTNLSWDNITNKPTTVSGYKITDVYTKIEVDQKLKNLSSSGDGGAPVDAISWYKVLDTPTTVSGYGITDVYNKTEINEMLSSSDVNIDEDELSAMLAEILV
jgi:hypothetical protein